MNLDAVYSSPAPAPKAVDNKILLPSLPVEALKFVPVPRQNSSTNFSDADLADLLPAPSLSCLFQQPEGAYSKGQLEFSRSLKNIARQEAGSLGQVYASLVNKQEEQRVPDAKPQEFSYTPSGPALVEEILTQMRKAAERNVPGSNQVVRPCHFVEGFGISPAGCPIPNTSNTNSSIVLPDGITLVHAGRAMNIPNSFRTTHQHLSKRFVRHADQSQGRNFNAPVPHPPSNNAVHPELVSALAGVPVSMSTHVAALTPISNTNKPSFINNVPNELPNGQREGGGHSGSDRGINDFANYSPCRGTSPHPGICDDDGMVSTRRTRRQSEHNIHHQQQEQECPADSAATDGTDGTGSRMSHSSLYSSDGESSQGGLAYEKINPDEITFEELSKMFIYKQNAAAEKMGIGSTTLKKICRRLGLTRWPSRHLKSLIKLRATLTTDAEIIGKFPEEERRRALTEIEESLRGRAVTKCLKDFRQKVFKNTHTLRTKNGGVKKNK